MLWMEKVPSPKTRFLLEDLIGNGTFAKVYSATDTETTKKVAIKIQFLQNNNTFQRFIQQEYKVLKNLKQHINIPDYYGIFRKDDEIWFILELCEGGSVLELVKNLLEQNRRMSEEHIAHILKEVVKAVVFLHENCNIHGDVRAKNVLVTKEGEIKLSDFGFSTTLKHSLDSVDGVFGSPCWMAPEMINCHQNQSKYDNRVDVWALGITAIELGDGKAPFQCINPTRTLFQINTNPPPTLERLSIWSENYHDFINECLVKNPEHRPYACELNAHPFLSQIPDNNYHLSLEIKFLIQEIKTNNISNESIETAIIDNTIIKSGSELEIMLPEDLASLDVINELEILKLLEDRTKTGCYQSYIGDVLISLNPFDNNSEYGDGYHEKYHLKSRSENPPHIYAIADGSYQYALHHQIPQKILLTGESGSGKTRNYLHLVNHLLYLGHNNNINLERIKSGIKLIHCLSHAATPVNKYSTRCIFTTDIKYGSTGKVSGAVFDVFQLEKWRVSLNDEENKKLKHYNLESDYQYRYLRKYGISASESSKNVLTFKKILKIFEEFELSNDEINAIFSIVAAIFLLGEVEFEDSNYNKEAIIANSETVEKIAELLKIDNRKFKWCLTNYCSFGQDIAVRKRRSVSDAKSTRDVLANNLYARLVDYLVATINQKLSVGRAIFGEHYSIQIIDYFGFECMKTNNLQQLFINCFNEQIQYHYLQRLFFWEYLDVLEEGLEYETFSYYDNKRILDELLSKNGIFSLIDDTSKSGKSGKYLVNLILNSRKDYISSINELEFSVNHFTGKINYNASNMSKKNYDLLPPEITKILRESHDQMVKLLFTNKLNKKGNLILNLEINTDDEYSKRKEIHQYSQMRNMRTAIKVFKALTIEMLKELSIGTVGTHFVRCIRTNLTNKSDSFNQQLIKQQVRALSITETTKLRKNGFAHRITFQEFLRRYKFLAFDFNENVEVDAQNCKLLLIRLKMEGWKIGKSKVFLKYYHEEYLARLYETRVKKIIKIQSMLRRFLVKCSMTKEIKMPLAEKIEDLKCLQMTEDEAAAIIQRAYRECTIRKSYADFAKDYEILDQKICSFIRPFAKKWQKSSIFHVLVLLRAKFLREMFNFTQQVHFYNMAVVFETESINEEVPLDSIDLEAQHSNWIEQIKPVLRKIPFNLEDIPFYENTKLYYNHHMNLTSTEKEETWNLPYKWRELVASKFTPLFDASNDDKLIKITFTRDSSVPLEQIPDADLPKTTKTKKPKEFKEEDNLTIKNKQTFLKEKIKPLEKIQINDNAKLANSDFDYIKPARAGLNPITELKQISKKNVTDDDSPFNFQIILKKTDLKKVEYFNRVQKEQEKERENDSNKKVVIVDLIPGITVEGIEYEL